jgi:hypothetical protein
MVTVKCTICHHRRRCRCRRRSWRQLLPLEDLLVWEVLCLAQTSVRTVTTLTKIVCDCSQRIQEIFCWDLELGYDFFLPHTFQFIVLHTALILCTVYCILHTVYCIF